MKKDKSKEDKPEKPNKGVTLADLVFELMNKKNTGKKEIKLKEKNDEKLVSEKKKKIEDTKSSILSNIFSNIADAGRAEEKSKNKLIEESPAEDRKEIIIHGGYGAAKSGTDYGGGASAPYTSYEKIFSHIGGFRAAGSYSEDHKNSGGTQGNEEGSFFLLDRQVMDDSIKSIKYRNSMMGESPLPVGGVSSADWELFKIWKVVDPVMYNLKMRTV